MKPDTELAVVLIVIICVLFFLFLAIIDVAVKANRPPRRGPQPHKVIGIDGDNYVILEVHYGSDGSRTLSLIDQGTFEKRAKRDDPY